MKKLKQLFDVLLDHTFFVKLKENTFKGLLKINLIMSV